MGLELRLLRHRTSTRRMMIIQMALISRVGSWHSSIRQVNPTFFCRSFGLSMTHLQVIWYTDWSTNCPRCFKLGSPTVLPLPSRAKVGVKTLEEQLANQSWDGWLVESSRNSLNCEFPKKYWCLNHWIQSCLLYPSMILWLDVSKVQWHKEVSKTSLQYGCCVYGHWWSSNHQYIHGLYT